MAILRVVLLAVDGAARPIQLALDSRTLPRREFAARPSRAGFIQPDLSLPPLKPRRLDPSQFAAANALSNPRSLIVLPFVDASLSQTSRRDYDGNQRRHSEPLHEPLHSYTPPVPAAS